MSKSATSKRKAATSSEKSDKKRGVAPRVLQADELGKIFKEVSASNVSTSSSSPHSSPHSSPASIVNFLKSHQLSSPFIIVGEDRLRVRRLVRWLQEKLFVNVPGSVTSSLAISSYFGSELTTLSSIRPITENLRSLSLFSNFQLTILYDGDSMKIAVAKPLAQAISLAAPSQFIVLTGTSLKSFHIVNELETQGTCIELPPLEGNTLTRWIEKEVRSLGVQGGIAPNAISLLVKRYGSDVSAISQELTKLSLLVSNNEAITPLLIQQINQKSPEHTTFELMNEMANKNLTRSLYLTRQLFRQGFHPLQLCNFLTRSFRTVLAHKALQQKAPVAEKNRADIPAIPGDLKNPWFVRNLRSAQDRFSLADTTQSLLLLSTLDLKLKSSKLEDTLLVSTAIQKVCLRAFS